MGTDINSLTAAGTIFKFTPSGDRIVFGSVPGTPDATQANWGLAFDSAGISMQPTATHKQFMNSLQWSPHRLRRAKRVAEPASLPWA